MSWLGEDHSVIAAVVKAAIGEGKLYVTSVSTKCDETGFAPFATIVVQGDIMGTFELSGPLANKVATIIRSSRPIKQRDVVLEAILDAANERVKILEGRLQALHQLSGSVEVAPAEEGREGPRCSKCGKPVHEDRPHVAGAKGSTFCHLGCWNNTP